MFVQLVMADLIDGGLLAQAAPVKDSGTGWMIAGVGAVLLMYMYLRGRAKKKRDPLAEPSRMNTAQHKHLDRQMHSLVVELSEMAREMSAQIDTRSQKLMALMGDADRKIEELQRLKSELEAGERGLAPSAGRMMLVSDGPQDERLQDEVQQIEAPLVQLQMHHDVLLQHAEIYQLADLGANITDICQRVGKPSGEVELILSLRNSPRRTAL
jgi:hypothetical protein